MPFERQLSCVGFFFGIFLQHKVKANKEGTLWLGYALQNFFS